MEDMTYNNDKFTLYIILELYGFLTSYIDLNILNKSAFVGLGLNAKQELSASFHPFNGINLNSNSKEYAEHLLTYPPHEIPVDENFSRLIFDKFLIQIRA